MKEIWELAISPSVLPLTILLIPVAIFWLLSLIGAVDHDIFGVDFDGHDGHHGHDHPAFEWIHGSLRILNARDVPVMIVLSILIILLWAGAMVGNLWFNAGQSGWTGGIIVIAALVAAVILTRFAVAPLKPFFRMLRADDEKHPPVIGRTGLVRTATVDERSGQVEIENAGAPLLLNVRLVAGAAPLPRNAEVIVVSHDAGSGIYTVRSLSETIPPL